MLELLPDVWQPVRVEPLRLQLDSLVVPVLSRVNHSVSAFCTPVSHRSGLIELPQIALVNSSMPKTSLISTLVNDHGIFHVVACVRNYCDYCIGPLRILSEIILLVTLGLNKGLLREKNSVDLVIHSKRVVVIGSSHGLLSHLALIHITRRLIVFG